LAKAPEYNGKTGTVLRFDEGRTRYDVEIPGAAIFSVRQQCMTQRRPMHVFSLEARPELNGVAGDIAGYSPDSGRYAVALRGALKIVSLQRANCRLTEGTCVVTDGLSAEQYNGRMATIVDVDMGAGRYRVKFQTGEEIRVKFDKVIC